MMKESIKNLFNDFSDCLEQSMVAINKGENMLMISYIYKSYDLIDKDLDFDEIYYVKLMNNFKKTVESESRLFFDMQFTSVKISCFKLVMREDIQLEYETFIDQSSITTTVYTT